MDSILDALQEGRLLELPDNDKERSLKLLAHVIEAIPSLPPNTDVAGMVWARETAANTSLGMGWACPHARIPAEGDLMCAIGWSPSGIAYGPAGDPLVRVVVMYLVPENQKNHYLKELSSLVKALKENSGFQHLETATDLNMVRNRLLDLISSAKEVTVPDARARMIQLEAKTSAQVTPSLAGMLIESMTLIAGPGMKPLILTQNRELLQALEANQTVANAIAMHDRYDSGPWRFLRRSATHYQGDRIMYDFLAIRPTPAAGS